MPPEKKRALAAIAAATIVGGVLRLGTVGWGLPILLHVDEKGFVMWEAIATEHEGLVHDDFRPHASVYGPPVYELAIAVKWALWGGPETARPIAEEHPSPASYHQNEFDPRTHPEAHYDLAEWTRAMRTVSALLGTLAILLLARAAWRLRGPTAGAVAAVIAALAPGLVQVGHFYTADALLVPEIAMFADACALIVTGGGAAALAYAAAALALIALTKLPGLVVGLLLPFAVAWSGRSKLPVHGWRSRLALAVEACVSPRTLGVVALAVVLFVLAQPWLLDGRGMPAGEGNRSGLVMLGLYFTEREFPWHDWRFTYNDQIPFLYWLGTIFPYALGGPVALAGYVGLARAVTRDRALRFAAVLAVPSFLLCGAWGTMTIRHGLPVVPGLVLAASFVLVTLLERSEPFLRAIGGGALAWLGVYGIAWGLMFTEEDPRLLAGRWLSEHVVEGDVIATDPEAPYTAVLADDADFIGVPDYTLPPVTVRRFWTTLPPDARAYADAENVARGARFIVVGDFYLRRALHRTADRREPEHARFYRDLFEGRLPFVLVAHFDRRPRLGPLSFDESGAEALSVDFDHMPVWIFERHGPPD